MKLPVSFDQNATTDLIDAVAWYENKRSGLGQQFFAEVRRCADLAGAHSSRYPIVQADIRRVALKRFPYALYFRAEPGRVIVLAIFHTRRNPSQLTP